MMSLKKLMILAVVCLCFANALYAQERCQYKYSDIYIANERMVILSTGQPVTGLVCSYYKNGYVFAETSYKDGIIVNERFYQENEKAEFSTPLKAQIGSAQDVSGDWIAVFGDSVSAGTLALNLAQSADGLVAGQYQTSLGGVGMATGQIEGSHLALILIQSHEAQCPGTYRGSITFTDDAGSGIFTGQDCQGVHDDGVISINRKGTVHVPTAVAPRDNEGNVMPYTVIYENGQPFWVSELESVFVAIAGSEVGNYFQLTVLVGNDGGQPVAFFPETIRVIDKNSRKELPYKSPEKIAKSIRRRAIFSSALSGALMAFGNGLQAYSNSMVSVRTTGTISMYDNHGNWARGNFAGTSTAHVPVDNAKNNAEIARNAAAIAGSADRRISALTTGSLRAQTLAPGTYIVGTVMFPRAEVKNMKALVGKNFKSYYVDVFVPIGTETVTALAKV